VKKILNNQKKKANKKLEKILEFGVEANFHNIFFSSGSSIVRRNFA